MSQKIQWVGPAPPLRTGIAAYSADFFRAVDGRWNIDVMLEKGSGAGNYDSIRTTNTLDPDVPTIIHIGNSEFHDRAYSAAHEISAVVVLHDVVLHHARAARMLRLGQSREYWRELQREYGAAGVDAGRALLAGRDLHDVEAFPLCESFVRNARVAVVHSEYAAQSILSRVPDANVRVVPMGIPIPAQIPRSEARNVLGISPSSFVIASVTHVNPNKRLPVVLRALRRLVARDSDVMLILAGTGTDDDALSVEIRMMGLQDNVRQLGYVDDTLARLVAASADACVNLRYPTTGETSASLLRLLGAGLPVLVSDAGTSGELPDGVGLKIPVDDFEVEMVTEVLWELAANCDFRTEAGKAARDFIVSHHSMVNEVDGYRAVLREAYEIYLPLLEEIPYEISPPLV
ncbi:MAG: glycosyltransferase family 4 protein, partial [Thermomicrobiales bacterium]